MAAISAKRSVTALAMFSADRLCFLRKTYEVFVIYTAELAQSHPLGFLVAMRFSGDILHY